MLLFYNLSSQTTLETINSLIFSFQERTDSIIMHKNEKNIYNRISALIEFKPEGIYDM